MLTAVNVLQAFKHLQFIDLSSNMISDISPLQRLTLIHELDCSSNQITDIPDCTWPFLAKLDLSRNKIARLPRMTHPLLQAIYLNHNRISSLVDKDGNYLLEEENLPKLHTLELRRNQITANLPTLNGPLSKNESNDVQKYLKKIGLYHSGLKFLILADNKINTMASVYKPPGDVSGGEEVTLKVNEFGSRMGLVPNLVVLHLRKNGIRSLQGFTKEAFASLKYLNLRENQITNLEDIQHLSELKTLQHLVLTGKTSLFYVVGSIF
ncbi:unnamed protein product [Mesocestoides corti]|uniref:Uncharacterized protein n=1 Tax=Mesocestoides corti TaxID=53468 RepID=A0A3P6HKR1_MESCO|nr:unnamed protein product [Mesocestoides corti]